MERSGSRPTVTDSSTGWTSEEFSENEISSEILLEKLADMKVTCLNLLTKSTVSCFNRELFLSKKAKWTGLLNGWVFARSTLTLKCCSGSWMNVGFVLVEEGWHDTPPMAERTGRVVVNWTNSSQKDVYLLTKAAMRTWRKSIFRSSLLGHLIHSAMNFSDWKRFYLCKEILVQILREAD